MRRRPAPVLAAALATVALAAAPPAAEATWSVVIADTVTGEVAVGSATCVTGIDLLALTPVMVVGVGGAAAQSVADSSGVNRGTIWDGFFAGLSPEEILDELEATDPQHESRQYGIVDVPPNPEVTFTGANAGAFAGGVTGRVGDLVYAIQGNLLTGQPVIDRAEQALASFGFDVPTKLMVAMLAAYRMGGDGRCSCSIWDPTGCGSPPDSFTKSAHVGYMVVSRLGDTDGSCSADGCANGDYYLSLDVPFQGSGDLDPVLQLRDLFVGHRLARVDRPDHYASELAFSPPDLPADGTSTSTGTLTVRDWRGEVVPGGGAEVSVSLAPESTSEPAIGPVVDHGDGTYTFEVTADTTAGTALFRVEVDDGVRPVRLAPDVAMEIGVAK